MANPMPREQFNSSVLNLLTRFRGSRESVEEMRRKLLMVVAEESREKQLEMLNDVVDMVADLTPENVSAYIADTLTGTEILQSNGIADIVKLAAKMARLYMLKHSTLIVFPSNDGVLNFRNGVSVTVDLTTGQVKSSDKIIDLNLLKDAPSTWMDKLA